MINFKYPSFSEKYFDSNYIFLLLILTLKEKWNKDELTNLNSTDVEVGIGDDGAIIDNNPNYQTVVTTEKKD
ncbi:hypothetical protein [Selenihalanaerobacter shriftii]|uniref:hypothetical protein n=1 Tax=Selenihalanaerobacter shriftii TaxID=142842 RepID=UPI0009999C30|nr:hypothetical protein [Selenihalanaerobacter shriftii]